MKAQLLFLLLIIVLPIPAQITTDGTLGPALHLPGPDYQIGADLGQQRGGNLFHSFQDFNLQSGESATFSGPNHIQNVISRVTGGNPSNIDGLLRSTIPGADVYFLNPYGIIFGPNARLDVQGSFHASTAHYLRLGDGGHFDARNPNDSILTVAPVESFGFLDSPVAPISIQGHGEVTPDWETQSTGLLVPEGKTLSLIGGKIEMWMGTFFKNESTEISRLPTISAPYGRINLVSVASQGEVKLGGDFVDVSSFNQLADIHIKENSLLQTSGEGGGSIFIRSGQFVVDNSAIEAKTLNSQNGYGIHINANNISLNESDMFSDTYGPGNAGSITINTKNISLNKSNLSNDTHGQGNAGSIAIKAEDMSLTESRVISDTHGNGKAGIITIETNKISLNKSYLISDTHGEKNAGAISIEAKEISLNQSHIISDTHGGGHAGSISIDTKEIYLNKSDISNDTHGQGNAGSIVIEAWEISLNQSKMSNDTHGNGNAGIISIKAKEISLNESKMSNDTHGNGNAGTISIKNTGTVRVVAINAKDDSRISSNTSGIGHAGKISIETNNLFIEGAGYVASATFAAGKAGNVDIHATGIVSIVGANANTGRAGTIGSSSKPELPASIGGQGGDIQIEAKELIVRDGGQISVSSIASRKIQSRQGGNITIHVSGPVTLSGVNPYGENEQGFGSGIYARSIGENAGAGGSIELSAGSLTIQDGAVIGSSTNNINPGGNIKIDVNGSVHINGDTSQIELLTPGLSQEAYLNEFSPRVYNRSTSGIYASSRHPSKSAGPGGNIILIAQALTMTNKGRISTISSGSGQAGTITITVNQLQLDSTAKISSESLFTNTFKKETSQFVISGDIVEIADEGNGKTRTRFMLNEKTFITITPPIDTVANLAELNQLSHQKNPLDNGQIIQVKDIGNGESARFVYYNNKWHNLEAGNTHKVANINELYQLQYAQTGYVTIDKNEQKFYYSGTEWLPLEGEPKQIRGGNAGTIIITAHDGINLSNGGKITTQANMAGGGQIMLKIDGLLQITNGKISSSVQKGAGNGGNLTLNSDFIILENGKIIARAYEGNGGNMNMTTTGIYRFGDESASPIDASSKLGVDGEITVNSPDSDISGQLLVLSTDMVDAADQMQPPCSSIIAENLSSFVVVSREGASTSPDDLLPSGPHLSKLKPVAKNANSIKPRGTTVKSYPQMAYQSGCQPATEENSVMPEQLF